MPTEQPIQMGSTDESKNIQRYYTCLRDFMAYFHERSEMYPPNHEFSEDELAAVTPSDICRWMNVKMFRKSNPGANEKPLFGSHHTLDYYKKSLSSFMPNKDESWDPLTKRGNPTKSTEVNALIKRVKELQGSNKLDLPPKGNSATSLSVRHSETSARGKKKS